MLFSEQFYYNHEALQSLVYNAGLRETQISSPSGWYSGFSLLEILPLMEDVYSMDIETSEESYHFTGDDLANDWPDSYLIKDPERNHIIFQNDLYSNVTSLHFSGTPMDSDELEIWLSWEGIKELKDELNRFSIIHNIDIKAVEVPRPESKLISVVRANGKVPDIIMLQSSAIENLVRTRAIQNLVNMDQTDLIEQGKLSFTLDDKLWAAPFYFDSQVIFYNRDLVKNDIEKNWTMDDMEKIARLLDSDAIHPLAWNAYSSNWLIPFQVSFGKSELINREGIITVDDLPTEKALNYIISLQNQNILVPMERDAMDALFIAGKAAVIMSGSYAIPYFESLGLNFGVAPFPMNQDTGLPVSPLLDFKAFAITRRTDAPLLARRIIQYLTSSAVQQRFCPALAKLPVRDDVFSIPGINYGYLEVLKDSAERGTVIPPLNVYSIYKNNMWKLLRFALSGRMSVRQTLEQGQTLMNNTMEN